MLKMNWLPLRLFLFSIFFVSLSVFATESCDYFVNEVNSLKPEDTQAFFKGKIDYSKVYIEVPFLERMEPGIYLRVGYNFIKSTSYISEKTDEIQVYKEPNLARTEIDRFTPCIDKHVKANIDYFLKTCLYEKKLSNKNAFNQFASFMKEKYEYVKNYCECEEKINAAIIYVKNDGTVQVKKFNSPTCLDDSFDVDPVVREWRTIDSLVKELVEPFDDKCDWRNLVPNPKQFSDEKYKRDGWSLVLTEKDCPAL